MAPKKKAAAPAQENVSLGPLAGDGMLMASDQCSECDLTTL